MMLQSLYELAKNENLMDDPDYEWKPVRWLIRVGPGGKFLGIQCTDYTPEQPTDAKKKPRSLPAKYQVCREGGRTSGDRAFLLCDKSEYVFGVEPKNTAGKGRGKDKLALRRELFLKRILECLESTHDEGVEAVHRFLTSLADVDTTAWFPEEFAPNDLFSFVYDKDEQVLPRRPKVMKYWREMRDAEAQQGVGNFQCLVTGEPIAESGLFPVLKKVPGGTSSGVALVSFNKNAFESYGWSNNDNAPISREAAETCATALNRLLDPAWPDPDQPGQFLPKRNFRVSADTVVCFWSASPQAASFCDRFANLLDPSPEMAKQLYDSPWKGTPTDVADDTAFYVLVMSGAQGRAIVRDWFETTVGKVRGNIAQHFSDIEIVYNTTPGKDKRLPRYMPLREILNSLAPRGKSDQIPAHQAAELARSTINGTLYPISFLQKALERMRSEIGGGEWMDSWRRDARAALIKAVLNRNKRVFSDTKPYQEVAIHMDPNNDSQGYALGRMLAVLERLQQLALDKPNASVVDRYFSGASVSPKSVFIRLLKNARHHVKKARDDDKHKGMAFRLERILDELCSHFALKQMRVYPAGEGLPSHLSLEEQGLFILGYHQMRHWLWMSREDRESWEAAHEDAPKAYLWSKSKETAEAGA